MIPPDDPRGKRPPTVFRVKARSKPAPATPSRDRRLSSTDKAVAAALASYAWGQKTECWPSLSSIARDVGRCLNVVRLSIQNLEHFGYVRVEPDGSIKTGRRYHLLWKLPSFTPADPKAESPRERESARVAKAQGKATEVGAPLRKNRGVGAPPEVGAPLRKYGPESSNEEDSLRVEEFLAIEDVEADARALADFLRFRAEYETRPEADRLLLEDGLKDPSPGTSPGLPAAQLRAASRPACVPE